MPSFLLVSQFEVNVFSQYMSIPKLAIRLVVFNTDNLCFLRVYGIKNDILWPV